VSEPLRIVDVAELDFTVEPFHWAFAETERAAIAAHWRRRTEANPALYNGPVLLLARGALKPRPDGATRLEGVYFQTNFADFLAWRDFGFPGEPVANAFAMAALKSADGAFLLGEMAPHTANAGRIYFPSGTPDPSDVIGVRVDLAASARRELHEETGLSAEDVDVSPDWRVVFDGSKIACMKPMTLPLPAEDAKARIEAFLACDPHAELSRIHVVRRPEDLDRARMPSFVTAYVESAFGVR
jgi:8-oxo-dGTP pyrophosphatase MutT (NUDIX family)